MTINKEMVMEAIFLEIEREIAKAKNKEIFYEDIKRIFGGANFDSDDFVEYEDYETADRLQQMGIYNRLDELNDYLINSRGIRISRTKYYVKGKGDNRNHFTLTECKKGSWYDWR